MVPLFLDPAHRPADARRLTDRRQPPGLGRHEEVAHLYEPDPKLVGAVNAALAVGTPLLLAGEPGTGKSQLAWYLAWYFGVPGLNDPDDPEREHPQPFVFHTRSTSESDDLLYEFDTVAWFHASHEAGRTEPPDKRAFRTRGPLWLAFEAANRGLPAIVLIDEIDKAPRDFPNDLLHVLDQFEFRCKPTGEPIRVEADRARPVVVITSNAENRLPEPFLRRCIFHSIELDRPMIDRIVAARARDLGVEDEGRRRAFVDQFFAIRRTPNLRKSPGTAELLVWIALCAGDPEWKADLPLGSLPHLGALLKDREDRALLG